MTSLQATQEGLLIQHFGEIFRHHSKDAINQALRRLPRNVRLILLRQHDASNKTQEPCIELIHEADLLVGLERLLSLDHVLFHLARVYDEIWFRVFQNWTNARRGKSHDADLATPLVSVELQELLRELLEEPTRLQCGLRLSSERRPNVTASGTVVTVSWQPHESQDLSDVPVLSSLSSVLPGEELFNTKPSRTALAGIGTGGGSDVVSASLLGHLFRESAGRNMDLIISTRSWRTGSQGRPGSGQIGTKREIHEHGGNAMSLNKRPVPGTYRILERTRSEGRDLETIPLKKHKEIWLVLDQGEENDVSQQDNETVGHVSMPLSQRAALNDQFYSIILGYNLLTDGKDGSRLGTIVAVDTGGDVFEALGPSTSTFSTPDQDKRTILALTQPSPTLSDESSEFYLTLAVLCPGLDSPPNMPEIVKNLGGFRYVPNSVERRLMIQLLTDEYHMDGRDHSRFGKSSLCLLAALQRVDDRDSRNAEMHTSLEEDSSRGEWVNLPLPEHVIQTRDNPWASFVWITDDMAEIIFVPMKRQGDALRST